MGLGSLAAHSHQLPQVHKLMEPPTLQKLLNIEKSSMYFLDTMLFKMNSYGELSVWIGNTGKTEPHGIYEYHASWFGGGDRNQLPNE